MPTLTFLPPGGSSRHGKIRVVARINVSIVVQSGARIGPGKAALLQSVRDSGSIAAAARAMDMDYKRAWSLIESLNRAFDTPLVERVRGGARGGGATLTPFGLEVLTCYQQIEAATTRTASRKLRLLDRHALPSAGRKI